MGNPNTVAVADAEGLGARIEVRAVTSSYYTLFQRDRGDTFVVEFP